MLSLEIILGTLTKIRIETGTVASYLRGKNILYMETIYLLCKFLMKKQILTLVRPLVKKNDHNSIPVLVRVYTRIYSYKDVGCGQLTAWRGVGSVRLISVQDTLCMDNLKLTLAMAWYHWVILGLREKRRKCFGEISTDDRR